MNPFVMQQSRLRKQHSAWGLCFQHYYFRSEFHRSRWFPAQRLSPWDPCPKLRREGKEWEPSWSPYLLSLLTYAPGLRLWKYNYIEELNVGKKIKWFRITMSLNSLVFQMSIKTISEVQRDCECWILRMPLLPSPKQIMGLGQYIVFRDYLLKI